MSAGVSDGSRLQLRLPAWIDAITYAFVIGGLFTLGSLFVALLTGGDLVRVKYLLFFAGWVLLGVATVRLWPRRGEHTDGEDSATRSVETPGRVQRIASDVPPARWVREPSANERLSDASKQFLAAIVTLAISFTMEIGFGVA